jgi:hypothetical protein
MNEGGMRANLIGERTSSSDKFIDGGFKEI